VKLGKNLRIDLDIWPFSEDTREHGAPSRIYINTPDSLFEVRTGLPYLGFRTLHRGSYKNQIGKVVQMYDVIGRTWKRERFKIRREDRRIPWEYLQ
jgi:hypothetical protein